MAALSRFRTGLLRVTPGCFADCESGTTRLRRKQSRFDVLLDAFLAVRALRVDRGIELDRYYLGNLRIGDTPLSRSDSSIPMRSWKPPGI